MSSLPQLDLTTFPSQILWGCLTFLAFWGFTSSYVMPRIMRINLRREQKALEMDLEAEKKMREILEEEEKASQVIQASEERINAAKVSYHQEIQSLRRQALKTMEREESMSLEKSRSATAKSMNALSEKIFYNVSEILRDMGIDQGIIEEVRYTVLESHDK